MSCLHRGPYIQRGRGFGSALSSVYRGVVPKMRAAGQKVLDSPLTKDVLKTAKNAALEGGLNIATDLLKGKKLRKSVGENVTTAKKLVTDLLVTALSRGRKRKRVEEKSEAATLPAATTTKVKKMKREYGDLFESY
jgi:hypothetical protein